MGTSKKVIPKDIGCSPHANSKVPLLKATSIQLIGHRAAQLVPIQRIHLYESLVQEDTMHATKE